VIDHRTREATGRLTRFVHDATTGTLRPALITTARRHVADTLACILAGAGSDAVRMATAAAGSSGRSDHGHPIPGVGRVLDPTWAALITGVAAHVEDFDDTSVSMRGHPSAPVLSALVPAAYTLDMPGDAFLLAYAVGVEAAAKLGRLLGTAHTMRGWHTMSTVGALGAVCACAKAHGLGEDEIARAIGIGASFAGGLVGNFGTMVKGLHCGKAAWTGVVAVELARKGFEANPGILEAEDGFVQVFGDRAGAAADGLASLGAPWDLLEPGIDIKIYPSCNCTHPAVDAAIDLAHSGRVVPDRIRRIRCWASAECVRYLVCPIPTTPLQAKFSMPYCVATALVRGRLGPREFTPDAVRDERVSGLMPRVSLEARAADRREDEPDLEVELDDGTVIRLNVPAPKGTPANPPSWADVESKFLEGGEGVLPVPVLRDALALVGRLDRLESVRPLFDRLTPAS